METTRIATIKQGPEAGKQYVVQRLHFGKGPNDPDKVYCLGEVVKVVQKGRVIQATHGPKGRTFLKDAVDVAEVERTTQLMQKLFAQHLDGLRTKGHVLERRGRTVVDHGTREQIEQREAVRASTERWLEESGLMPALRESLQRNAAFFKGAK